LPFLKSNSFLALTWIASLSVTLFFTRTCLSEEADRYRPRFHFTPSQGYMNDPNGLVYLDGTYHLFFQHGPIGNKSWGHATSADLLHWNQLPEALLPERGCDCFSGSAVLDPLNTAGFGANAMILCFTSWGQGQSLAYSLDKGHSFRRFSGNPVLKRASDEKRRFPLSSRDPHVMWDGNHKRWVMVLYDNVDQISHPKDEKGSHRKGFSIFSSSNLKDWSYESHLPDFYVCPDLFQLEIEGTNQKRWVAMDWERYTVGHFDSREFQSSQQIMPLDYGTSLSANQSWKNLPDGRTVQVCWLRGGKYPGMAFDQQLSIPTELSLRPRGERLELCKNPIRELLKLREGPVEPSVQTSESIAWVVGSESFDLEIEVDLSDAKLLELELLGHSLEVYQDKVLALGKNQAAIEPIRSIRVLADVTSIELFINSGVQSFSYALLPQGASRQVEVTNRSNAIRSATLYRMKSCL
jgi:fructan beta-fructosidase